MINSRAIITAAAVGVLGGALFALWATLAEAQASSSKPSASPNRQAPAATRSLASR
jgi:hypothetical protein